MLQAQPREAAEGLIELSFGTPVLLQGGTVAADGFIWQEVLANGQRGWLPAIAINVQTSN